MRIISGEFRGRKLVDSSHLKDLRPTTDRNREALFNILQSAKFLERLDFKIQDAKVLDLCCGTGAVAFEAMSRGAAQAFLIDKNPKHLEIAKKNAEVFKVEDKVTFLLADAEKLSIARQKFDLVFIDPPYSFKVDLMLKKIIENNWIDKKSLIVIESKYEQKLDESLELLDSRSYGGSWFGFFVMKDGEGES